MPNRISLRSIPKIAVYIGCLALSSWLGAAPFSEQIEFTQPDGTVIRLNGRGDEFYAVFETLNGYTVVFDQGMKAYCYARLTEDAMALVSTGVQVHIGDPAALGLAPHLRMALEAIRNQVRERRARWDADTELSTRWTVLKMAKLAEPDRSEYAPPDAPTLGTKAGLTLLIDFDDDAATIPQANVENYCNGDNYAGYGNNGSVKKYFSDNSNGTLIYSNVVTIYIRAPQPKTFYNDTTKDAGAQGRKLILDVLNVMKNLPNYNTEILPTFNALTTDGQNRVVAFNVFYAGGNGGVWSKGLWPHSWALSSAVELSPGGKKVFRYQITNMGSSLKLGTFVHENGHMLCGFPDIYDYDYDSTGGAGYFCLMNTGSFGDNERNPSQICAYLKSAAGWATLVSLTAGSSSPGSLTVLPGTNFNRFYRFQKPGVSTEYFIAECRFKTNRDTSLPASGVAIWHVDELGDHNDQRMKPNTTHDNYEVTLVQADNRWDFQNDVNHGDANDLYYLGNRASGYQNTLSDASAPHAHWWDGSPSGLVFRDFSAAGPTMTFLIGTNDPIPAIVSHPVGKTVIAGQAVSFTVQAAGVEPLKYQWHKNGGMIPGATASSWTIPAAQPSDAGAYSAVVSNLYGFAPSRDAILTVIPTVSLPLALNNSNLTWTTDSPAFWYGQTNLSRDGVAAAKSMAISHGEQTALRSTVTGPGTLSFWWRVSSQPTGDSLRFSLGGVEQGRISGETGWNQPTFYLPDGNVPLEWKYAKDASVNLGQDAGWVDEVSYVVGPTLPFISTPPLSQSTLSGVPVTFVVVADGTPPLAYQWRRDNSDVPGATGTAYTIASPAVSDTGSYSVRVMNAYGSVVSMPAMLGVVRLAASGDNSFGQTTISAAATNAIAVSAGAWHTLALNGEGDVLAWGYNVDGQCAPPLGLSNAVAIAAGGYHSLALRADKSLLGWGANDHGQASPPSNLGAVIAIAAGSFHSLALRVNETVACWGANDWGQCNVPTGISNVIAVAAGGNHSLALRRDGTVRAWGENTDAQGIYVGQSIVPVGLSNVVAIAAGEYHSLALRSNGTVVAWGDNSQGQTQVPQGLSTVVGITAGGAHSIALLQSGRAVAWGANWNGQCNIPPMATNILVVTAGSSHTLTLVGSRAPQPALRFPVRLPGMFTLLLQTFSGEYYALEYKHSLADPAWSCLGTLPGNGVNQFLVDRQATPPQRFYRVRKW